MKSTSTEVSTPASNVVAKKSTKKPDKPPLVAEDAALTKSESIQPLETKKQKLKFRIPKSKLRVIEDYLTASYKFRYNIINDRIELTGINSETYKTMDDYMLNSIVRQMERKANIKASGDRLKSLLKSDFTPIYHPVRAYFLHFDKTPTSGETTNIDALAATVTVIQVGDNDKLFQECLTRWLVASIANALSPDGCQNHTCIVLTGNQGAFKTTFLDLLTPPILIAYRFTGKIDLNSKDTLILLGEKFIINLDDQLRTLNKSDAETVKTFITQGNITTRRPYAAYASDLSRLASFCASVNGNDFLSDPTGSRRFLPFEVSNIDIKTAQAIDINKVWQKAYQLYKEGYQYWFTDEETTKWFGDNAAFQVQTVEDELLAQYFEPAEKSSSHFWLSSDIKKHIEALTGQRLDGREFGKALRKAKFVRYGKKFGKKTLYGFAISERMELNVEGQTSPPF